MTNTTSTDWQLGSLFTGQLIRLAARQPEDHAAFSRWTEDAEYTRLMYFSPAAPRAPETFEDKKDDHDNGSHFNFTFRTLADDKLIGQGGLGMHWSNQSAWLWLGIGEPDYRNRGYGTDAMRLLVNYAFRELGAYRIELGVFGFNMRAMRVYEKLGFVHEGAQREALYRDGQRFDLYAMSLLRPEWEALPHFQAVQSMSSIPEPI